MEFTKKTVILLVAVAIMIGGMFWGIQFASGQDNQTQGQTLSGTADFNGTIRIYDPILLIVSEISDPLLTKLRNDERIKAVESTSGGQLLNISTREDVYSVAEMLRSNGVESKGVANIVLPTSLDVRLGNGTLVKVSTGRAGSIKVVTEPLVDADNEVPVTMMAVIINEELVNYNSPIIVSSTVKVNGNASIVSIDGKNYEFTIPWESRAEPDVQSLKEKYGNESVSYERNDLIAFPKKLTVLQQTEIRTLPYVTFISESSALVAQNFTDREQAISDFNNVTIIFPDSLLNIVANETVSLPYNGTSFYSYSVMLPAEMENYSLNNITVQLTSSKVLNVNETIGVNVQGLAMGSRIVKIRTVEPN